MVKGENIIVSIITFLLIKKTQSGLNPGYIMHTKYKIEQCVVEIENKLC